MILVLFVLRFEGALAACTLAAVVGWFATVHGHGPICLMHTASPEQRLLVLQLFLWICLATALPVGALLDERRRAERSAVEAQSIDRVLFQNTTRSCFPRSPARGALLRRAWKGSPGGLRRSTWRLTGSRPFTRTTRTSPSG